MVTTIISLSILDETCWDCDSADEIITHSIGIMNLRDYERWDFDASLLLGGN